jgi:hypothetical protein
MLGLWKSYLISKKNISNIMEEDLRVLFFSALFSHISATLKKS